MKGSGTLRTIIPSATAESLRDESWGAGACSAPQQNKIDRWGFGPGEILIAVHTFDETGPARRCYFFGFFNLTPGALPLVNSTPAFSSTC